MKKKIIAVVAILLCVGTVNVFAFGIGVQAGGTFGTGVGGGAALTFSFGHPWYFAVDFGFGDNSFGVGVTGDYWFYNPTITGPLSFYIGGGIFGSVWLGDNVAFTVGGRIPIGLDLKLAKNVIELYLQVAPGFGARIASNSGGFYWTIPVNLGVRFWF
ncbi:hypothetical protein K7I13_05770 [Brucepastera parasyntrophica]|uniref:hypothetical protein n=1 Tax=Brucepastera parasyntrophica TaxID=2880008 RepID=UPI00210AF16F|nr:hypothetical protein [Brucepastera parasyntrophica]ULQ60775.1 hypothetical protein K7I13_05770 [Brucepastera parasyntrophica]